MRIMVMAVAGIVGAALLAPSVGAVPAPGQNPLGVQNIVPIAEGCGWGWHWVPGHRRPDGAWIPGRCVRNY